MITLLDQYDVLKEKGVRRVSPHTVPMLMPNGPAANVGLEVNAQAGVHTPVSACASGAEAIGYAVEMIRTGRADVVLAGGTEAAIHPLPIAAFANMMAMSKNNDEPEKASRPYDTGRDGFVLGEGAGVVVLESAEHAAARGAKVYCEVLGQGLSADAHHIAQPEPTGRGIAAAMQNLLDQTDLKPSEVVHLNAHATSTPQGDVAELKALRKVLGDDLDHVAISATKSMTGHLLGGAGGIETVATVLALHHRMAPPTINVENLDEAVEADIVRDEPRPLPEGSIAAINNSFGFGGTTWCWRSAASDPHRAEARRPLGEAGFTAARAERCPPSPGRKIMLLRRSSSRVRGGASGVGKGRAGEQAREGATRTRRWVRPPGGATAPAPPPPHAGTTPTRRPTACREVWRSPPPAPSPPAPTAPVRPAAGPPAPGCRRACR